MTTPAICDDCGRHWRSCSCGMTYREKLLSVQIPPSAMPTRTKRDYFDSDAVNAVFGEDSREQLMEETKGLGAAKLGPDGKLRTREGAGPAVGLDQAEVYLAADREEA